MYWDFKTKFHNFIMKYLHIYFDIYLFFLKKNYWEYIQIFIIIIFPIMNSIYLCIYKKNIYFNNLSKNKFKNFGFQYLKVKIIEKMNILYLL